MGAENLPEPEDGRQNPALSCWIALLLQFCVIACLFYALTCLVFEKRGLMPMLSSEILIVFLLEILLVLGGGALLVLLGRRKSTDDED